MDVHALRQTQFPVTERWVYFDHAAVAPVSQAVQRAVAGIVRDVAENGIAHIAEWHALYAGARRSAARLLGARADDIAFLKNTTDGLIAVALGIDWRRGDSVVLAEGEFPANVYPWTHLQRRGVDVHRVPRRRGGPRVDDYAAAIDATTRVLTVSSVSFFTGARADLAALGSLCRERGLLFVVDGIQSVGALRVDVANLGIDCLAADGHKWLLGPEGCALFYTSRRARSRLQVAGLGWASVRAAGDFLDTSDATPHADARRYETGTRNTAGIAGLKAAMDLLLRVGMDTVEARVLGLSTRLATGLLQRGFQVLAPVGDSGIVTLRSERHGAPELAAALRAHTVQFTKRGGTIRLSPHFYNTDSEIDRVLEALPAAG